MTRFRVWPGLLLAAGLFLVTGGTPAQPQPKLVPLQPQPFPGQPVPVAPGQGELPLVPKSAAAFVSVKVSALVEHPDLKAALEQIKKAPDVLDGVTEMVGVPPHEIDRVTLFWPTIGSRGPGDPVLVVTTRAAYNEARVLKSLKAEPVFDLNWQRDRGGHGPGRGHDHEWGGAVKQAVPPKLSEPPKFSDPPKLELNPPKFPDPPKLPDPKPPGDEDACGATAEAAPVGEPLFYELPRGPFGLLFLVDDRTLAFLPSGMDGGTSQLALLAQLLQKKPTGPLADAIAAGAGHTLAAGIHLTPLLREFDRKLPPDVAPYAALTAARTAVLTGDLGKTAKLTLTLTFDDAAAARRAGPVLEEGLKALGGMAAQYATEMKGRGLWEKALAPLLGAAAAGMKAATVKTNGTTVVATTDVDVGPAAAKAAADLLEVLASKKKHIGRTNNLKQIGLALHNYHDATGKFPTNVYNAKGEAILNWRVHLLPYMEYDNMYRQFKMDEPWDSENNKKFIEQMPKVYEVPGRDNPKGKTFLQAFVGPNPAKPLPKGANPVIGRAWLAEGDKQGRVIATIADGTSNTLAVVEARDAVIWSKPDDLPFGEKLPPLGEAGADQFAALFFDGHTAMLSTRIAPETLRALITLDGGEVVPADFDEDRRPGLILPKPVAPSTGEAKPPAAAPDKRPPDEPLKEAEAAEVFLEAARADLVKQQAETAAQEARTKRVQQLFAQGAATKRELDEAQAALELAVARLKERETAVRIREVHVADSRRALGLSQSAPRPPEKK